MDKLWRITTVWADGAKNTIYVWAKERNEANIVAQYSLNHYEKIIAIEEV